MSDQFFGELVSFAVGIIDLEYSLTHASQTGETTPQQLKILRLVFLSPGQTLSALSDCLGISLPNASREIKKLSDLGLVEKTGGTEDRRVTSLRLSPAGMTLVQALFDRMAEIFYRKQGTWDEGRMAETRQAMAVLQRNLLGQSEGN